MILLSAIIACIFLISIAMFTASIRDAERLSEENTLDRYTVDNALMAQDRGLAFAGNSVTGYPWATRHEAVAAFKMSGRQVLSDISADMLKSGVAYSFRYDDLLTAGYSASNPEEVMESLDGVLIKNENGVTVIHGYGYDARFTDGETSYTGSVIKTW